MNATGASGVTAPPSGRGRTHEIEHNGYQLTAGAIPWGLGGSGFAF